MEWPRTLNVDPIVPDGSQCQEQAGHIVAADNKSSGVNGGTTTGMDIDPGTAME